MKIALFQNKRHLAPVSFVTGLFLLLTLLVNPLNVSAAEVVSGELPYVVPDFQSINTAMNLTLMDAAYQKLISTNTVQSDDTVLFYVTDLRGSLGEYEWNSMYYICNPSVSTDVSGQYNYLTTNMTLTCEYSGQIEFKWNNTFRTIGQSYGNVSLLGNSSTIDISQGSYTPRYPFYLVGDDIKYGDIVVFTNTVNQGNTNVQGHAVPPDPTTSFLGNNADFGASISNSSFPSVPTISHYNPNVYNPPSIDNSTLESLVESLIDIIQYNLTYIISSIQGFVSSIITTIESYGKYVGSIIAYVGKAIITNIQYAIQNLYDNIVSLFEPILNFISEVLFGIKSIVDEIILLGTDENGVFSLTTLFVNLAIPDPEDLQDLIEQSDTFNVVSVFSSINTKIRQEYATLQGLTSQKIIHVPSCTFHGQEIGDYDIDFSWYDRYKALGDGIISAFLIWNYLWFLFFRFPYWIRGNSADFNGFSQKGSD